MVLELSPPPAAPDETGAAPHNLDAEIGLLGAVLFDNEAYITASQIVRPEHFYEPVHGEIFEAAGQLISQGRIANPELLAGHFAGHEALKAHGGADYLYDLRDSNLGVSVAKDYAREIFDMHLRRGLIRIGDETAHAAKHVTIGENPRSQVEDAEGKLYRLAEEGAEQKGFKTFNSSVGEAMAVAAAAYERDGGLGGLSTGLRDLDMKLGGFHRSDLVILAGRPSMGKTALATNIAFNIAKANRREKKPDGAWVSSEGGVVGFFSLEMSSEQLASRILADRAEVPSHKIRRGEITADEYSRLTDAAKELRELPIHIDDTGGLPIASLSARARRLKRQHGLDLIVVDYLQLVGASNRRAQDGRVQEVSEVTQGLKALAKDLDVPVLALSQLSRQVETRDDKRPQLSDLRESGSIEQDADVVMFVFREAYYVGRTKPPEDDAKFIEWQEKMTQVHGRAEVILGKQRHGPIGTVELQFTEQFTRFSDLAKDGYPQRA